MLTRSTSIKKASCIIAEDNNYKNFWDLWIVFVLLFVAVTLPYRIAFSEKDSILWHFFNYTVDLSFLIDMILTFFTAIRSPLDDSIITDKKIIATTYLKGWFVIDLVAIIPFDKLFEGG